MSNIPITIKNISQSSSSVDVLWSDNKKSFFHYLWLRDNCPSNIHPHARQRSFNLLTVSSSIHPKNILLNSKGNVQIIWSEGNHESCFDAKWLRNHCYTINSDKEYETPYIFWDQSLAKNLQQNMIEYEAIINTDSGLVNWLEQLNNYGFSLVKNAPTNKSSALKALKRISHIRETFFKTPFEVINIPKPNNTAYTAEGLRNHTDLPYFEYAPGYQFLHCLVNDAKGGESSVVDGFCIAKYLRENEPEVFSLLSNTYVKFKDNDYTQNTIRIHHSPLITITKDNDFNDIRFSVATMAAIDCNKDTMEKFYKAYRRFAELIHDSKYTVNFRLSPGDILSFNNRRVLHGRTEFDSNSGHRHLQGYYIDRDEILGRLNFLKNKEV